MSSGIEELRAWARRKDGSGAGPEPKASSGELKAAPVAHTAASDAAWGKTATFAHKDIADAHENAAEMHGIAADLSRKAGEPARAAAHDAQAKEHTDAAGKLKNAFGKSSMWSNSSDSDGEDEEQE